jgi:RNA polymerase sigma factor (sigma-70 family)
MSNEDEDALLLRRFVEERSQEAFSELVRLRIDLVYSAALRQVGGDDHMAREVAQTVFIDLIRHAPRLAHAPSITGWLYSSTRFAARKAWRKQSRWRSRQQEGHHMQELTQNKDAERAWAEIRPELDEAMGELPPDDRTVILSRFFSGCSMAEIARQCGVTENAARMRVDRALERLRLRFGRRGIQSVAAVLAGALSAGAVQAAPVGLAASVSGGSLAGAAIAGAGGNLALQTIRYLTMKKLALAAALVVLTLATGTLVAVHYRLLVRPGTTGPSATESQELSTLREQVKRLSADNSRLAVQAQSDPARSAEAAGLERLRVLAELQKSGTLRNSIGLVDGGGKLNRQFVEIYQLSPASAAALQRTLDASRAKMNALVLANAKVTEQSAGKVVVQVEPFPQAGGAAYDELMGSVGSLLGPDRSAAFAQLSADSLEDEFGAFGAAQRTLTITRDPASAGAPTMVEDKLVRSSDSDVVTTTDVYGITDPAHMERLGLGSMLPSEFQYVPPSPPPGPPMEYHTEFHAPPSVTPPPALSKIGP